LLYNVKAFVIDLRFQIARRMLFPVVNAAVTVALLLGICLLLIPTYGGVGAAWASLAVTTAGCILAVGTSVLVAGHFPLRLQALAKILVATVTMALILHGVEFAGSPLVRLGAKVVTGMVFYGAALILMNFQSARQAIAPVLRRRLGRYSN